MSRALPPRATASRLPPRGLAWICTGTIILALAWMIRGDLAHLRWVEQLSAQGSPAPAFAADSPTGYTLGQREFLAPLERGETYRWIAATQEALAGPGRASTYRGDTLPEGRPQLSPRLYTVWLTTLTWTLQLGQNLSPGVAAERVALWEPVISHVLIALALGLLVARRWGVVSATLAVLCFALYPPFDAQFLPGVLTPDTWALFAACAAIGFTISRHASGSAPGAISGRSAIAAAVALWLNPAFGFPAVLIVAAASVWTAPGTRPPAGSFLRWALVGAGLVTAAWAWDGAHWDPALSELRYVHPLYALAWLGLGLAMLGIQRLRAAPASPHRTVAWAVIAAAAALVAGLVYVQLSRGYAGWLYPDPRLLRLSSLEETGLATPVAGWLARWSSRDTILILLPALAAVATLIARFRRAAPSAAAAPPDSEPRVLPAAVAVMALFVLAWFRPPWVVGLALLAIPLCAAFALSASRLGRRVTLGGGVLLLFVFGAWRQSLPPALDRPAGADAASASQVEALAYRQFAHWLASHQAGAEVRVLAPPALSDSLIFHGHARGLLSTAWASHPGYVAASRILSSPESTEAEAVIESLGLTHIVLPAWDPVLPLLVKKPLEESRDTLHARLTRWVLPRYLRPMPYNLKSTADYPSARLPVFQVVPPQDEALGLSRLAEYFAEMERPEPARFAASALAQAFPQNPNAAMARALVAEAGRDSGEFAAASNQLVANVRAELIPREWDRRVIRAIVLALGKRHDLARPEIEACRDTMTAESLRELTPLQAFRLRKLMEIYHLDFPTPELHTLIHALSSEYRS